MFVPSLSFFVFIYKWHRKNAVFAQGPTTLPVASYTTALPEQVAGATWDGGPSSIGVRLELLHLAGRKTVVFLRHYTLETEHLPRQARDNDRENSEKDVFSLRAPPRDTADTGQLGRDTGKSRQIAPAFPLGLREKTRERLRCLNQGRRPALDCNQVRASLLACANSWRSTSRRHHGSKSQTRVR